MVDYLATVDATESRDDLFGLQTHVQHELHGVLPEQEELTAVTNPLVVLEVHGDGLERDRGLAGHSVEHLDEDAPLAHPLDMAVEPYCFMPIDPLLIKCHEVCPYLTVLELNSLTTRDAHSCSTSKSDKTIGSMIAPLPTGTC